MKDRYRFDDAYGKVYEYDNESKAYVFYGSYDACDIDASMSDETKQAIIENPF